MTDSIAGAIVVKSRFSEGLSYSLAMTDTRLVTLWHSLLLSETQKKILESVSFQINKAYNEAGVFLRPTDSSFTTNYFQVFNEVCKDRQSLIDTYYNCINSFYQILSKQQLESSIHTASIAALHFFKNLALSYTPRSVYAGQYKEQLVRLVSKECQRFFEEFLGYEIQKVILSEEDMKFLQSSVEHPWTDEEHGYPSRLCFASYVFLRLREEQALSWVQMDLRKIPHNQRDYFLSNWLATLLKWQYELIREPQPGDIVVYYENIELKHIAYYLGDGRVESKMVKFNRKVCRHQIDNVPGTVGTKIAFFRKRVE